MIGAEPPTPQDYRDAAGLFVFGWAVAAAGALFKILTDGRSRSMKQILVKIGATAFWGGLTAWALPAIGISNLSVIGAAAGVLSWAGYEATASVVMRLLGERLGVQLGFDRRSHPARRKDD